MIEHASPRYLPQTGRYNYQEKFCITVLHRTSGPMLKLGLLFFLCESTIYEQIQNDSATWVNLAITVKVKIMNW